MSIPEQTRKHNRKSYKRHHGGHDSAFPLTQQGSQSEAHDVHMIQMAERQIDYLCQGWDVNVQDFCDRFPDAGLHLQAMLHPTVFVGILCRRMWKREPIDLEFIREMYPDTFTEFIPYMRQKDRDDYGLTSFDEEEMINRLLVREQERRESLKQYS